MLVHYKASRVLGFKDRFIIPGINELPAEFVDEMLEDEIVAIKFDEGELLIIGKEELGVTKIAKKKGQKTSGVDLLAASNDRAALDMASKTVDVTILERWLGVEKRGKIRTAIGKQLAKIRNVKYRGEDEKSSKYEGSDKE